MHVTGYYETGNPTRSGKSTAGRFYDIAAAQEGRFPFGARLSVPARGWVLTVEDTGSGLRWNDLDILVPVGSAYALTGEYTVCLVGE